MEAGGAREVDEGRVGTAAAAPDARPGLARVTHGRSWGRAGRRAWGGATRAGWGRGKEGNGGNPRTPGELRTLGVQNRGPAILGRQSGVCRALRSLFVSEHLAGVGAPRPGRQERRRRAKGTRIQTTSSSVSETPGTGSSRTCRTPWRRTRGCRSTSPTIHRGAPPTRPRPLAADRGPPPDFLSFRDQA